MRISEESTAFGNLGFWLATLAVGLPTGTWLEVSAGEADTLPVMAIRQNVVEMPAVEIASGAKTAFAVRATEEELEGRVLLRFEAIMPFATEAGYASTARIAVNGVTLDDSSFPVNWGQRRTWMMPAVRDEPMKLYSPGSKTWSVRYDCDRVPAVEGSFYYSPEMVADYVYMFPIAKLLKPGDNRIEIENTSDKYELQLFACELGEDRTKGRGIENLHARRVTDTSIELAWDSNRQRYEIDYRPRGQTEWQTVLHVQPWENPYTLIMLASDTSYECRVRGSAQPVANLQGKVIPSPAAESPPIEVKTSDRAQIGELAGFRLNSTHHVPGGLTTYPCVESHGGLLWLVDGSLNLIKLDPKSGKLVFKREQPLAAWPMSSPRGYMGIPDTTILDGRLWVTYNIQPTRNPQGYEIMQSRQYLLSYDFATGQISEPVVVEPLKPEYGSWEGGVEVWQGSSG